MLVKDWMEPDVITVGPEMTSRSLWKTFLKHDIRRVPVVVEDEKFLRGIVSRTDLHRVHPGEFPGFTEEEKKASEIMSSEVVSISPDESIEEAASRMHKTRVACLPVVDDNNRVIGIISETDVFKAFYEMFGLNESSGQVQFQCGSYDEAVKQGIRSSEDEDRSPISFHTWHDPDTGEWNCLFRFSDGD